MAAAAHRGQDAAVLSNAAQGRTDQSAIDATRTLLASSASHLMTRPVSTFFNLAISALSCHSA